jgi:chromosome segregation ATPase
VTTSRILPIANLIGCLLITGIIIAQWLKERGIQDRVVVLNEQLASARETLEAEQKRATALESDVAQLKAAVEATFQARKQSEEAMAKLIAEREAQAATAANAVASNQETIVKQTEVWEKALAERDAKLRELNASLTATRARLDEAVGKLKAAGAR